MTTKADRIRKLLKASTGPRMTKADRIRKLLKAGFTSNEVAGIVGCLPEYVRAVKQRQPPRMTKSQELIERWAKHPNWKTQGVRRHG